MYILRYILFKAYDKKNFDDEEVRLIDYSFRGILVDFRIEAYLAVLCRVIAS